MWYNTAFVKVSSLLTQCCIFHSLFMAIKNPPVSTVKNLETKLKDKDNALKPEIKKADVF